MKLNSIQSYNPSFSAKVNWNCEETQIPKNKKEIENFANKIGSDEDVIDITITDEVKDSDSVLVRAYTPNYVKFYQTVFIPKDLILSSLKNLASKDVESMKEKAEQHQEWLEKYYHTH